MSPNFSTGDYLIVDEISYRFSSPQRGDVVVFDASFVKDQNGQYSYSGQRFIKRVIGLPGETVNISNGQVNITPKGSPNGKTFTLDEKYLPEDLKTVGEVNTTLKADEYFVMGDNREASSDSRVWGALDGSEITGRVLTRLFPIPELGIWPGKATFTN